MVGPILSIFFALKVVLDGQSSPMLEFLRDLFWGLHSIVEWDERRLVIFNATKMKLLSFNRHRDPLLVPVMTNGIELPEETSFHLLGLTFI